MRYYNLFAHLSQKLFGFMDLCREYNMPNMQMENGCGKKLIKSWHWTVFVLSTHRHICIHPTMAYIVPKTGEVPFVVDRKICFIRHNTSEEYFLDFRIKNSVYMSRHSINYNYSYEQKELYVLIPDHVDVSYYFASDFEISTYNSTTYMSIVSQPNILHKIRCVLEQQRKLIRVEFRNDVSSTTREGVVLDELCISSFFGEKVHEEMVMKIYQHTDCKIMKTESRTENEIGHKIRGVHEDFDVYRRMYCRKFQSRPTERSHPAQYNDVRRNAPPHKALIASLPQIPQVLENYTKTSYTLPNVNSNVGFMYENGLLTVTNGHGRGQHDEIAEHIAKLFDSRNGVDYQNKKRKM